MKIVIIHGWSDDNKGDSAIIMGMLNYFKTHFSAFSVSIVSVYDDYRNTCYDLNSFAKKHNIIIDKLTSPIGLKIDRSKNKLLRYFLHTTNILRKFLILLSPALFKFLLNKREKITLSVISNADFVISKGGHIFFSISPKAFLFIFTHGFYVFLAKRLKRKIALFSQSFGPFHGKITKFMFGKILEYSNLVMCREDSSLSLLKQFTAKSKKIKSKIIYFPDFAFNIKPIYDELFDKITSHNKNFFEGAIGITIRQHQFVKNNTEEYLSTIEKLIRKLIKNEEKIIIFPHVIGPTKSEDDRIIAERLYEKFWEEKQVLLLNKTPNAEVLCALYSKLKLLIGTRFHSVILSLNTGIPTFAISYSGPKADIMKKFNMGDYLISIEDVNSENLELIWLRVKALIENRTEIRKKIKNSLIEEKKHFENNLL
jgi:polysaccharide pyruvyl transferase WcaK-like protein